MAGAALTARWVYVDFTDFVKTVKSKKPYVEVIFLAAHGSIYEAVRAIKSGAFNYLVKGRNDEALLPALSEANEPVLDHEQSFYAEQKV